MNEDFLEDFEDFEDFDAEDFEDYDGAEDFEDYDPRRKKGRGVPRGAKRYSGVSQLNISIVNAGASPQKIELFNSMRSISKAANTGITTLTPFAAKDRAAANLNGLIYFNELGDLLFQNGAGGITTISCREIPYRALLDATMNSPFDVAKMRIAYSADAQIDEVLQYTKNTFLGQTIGDSINPRSFFDPTQQQPLTVDVKQSFKVDRESGIVYNALTGCNIRMTLFIPKYRKAGVKVR